MELSAEKVRTQAGYAVLGKALDQTNEQAAALAELMAAAELPAANDPALGKLVDLRA